MWQRTFSTFDTEDWRHLAAQRWVEWSGAWIFRDPKRPPTGEDPRPAALVENQENRVDVGAEPFDRDDFAGILPHVAESVRAYPASTWTRPEPMTFYTCPELVRVYGPGKTRPRWAGLWIVRACREDAEGIETVRELFRCPAGTYIVRTKAGVLHLDRAGVREWIRERGRRDWDGRVIERI